MHDSTSSKRRRKRVRPGASPGTLVGDPQAEKSRVRVIGFGPERFEEREVTDLSEIPRFVASWPAVWIDVVGVGDVETVSRVGELLHLHRLALEDVVTVGQRTKLDPYEEHLFLVLRVCTTADERDSQQVSIFLGPQVVVTFRERADDPFELVRQRVRNAGGRLRSGGSSYLAYALLDAIVDLHYPIVYRVGDEIEALEVEVLERPTEETLHRVHAVRSQLRALRRELVPQRDLIQTLQHEDVPWVERSVRFYLRDCADHANQLVDVVELYREVSSDLIQAYLSRASHRMNETMRVLTVISTIFIPLGVVASIYGMNFDPNSSPWNMPELRSYYGYPMVLLAMALIAGLMLLYFKRVGWLRS
jgi:magnesium transporter